MKFTIRPSGTLAIVERGLAKIYRDNPESDGGREELGDYKASRLPGGGESHRVFYDVDKRRYDVVLTAEELAVIVKDLRFIDPLTKKLIETADPRNEFDPFFIHEKLEIEVPNAGVTLDTDDSWGKYWWGAVQAEPKKFDVDNSTDNPLVRKVQSFKVTTAGHSEAEVNQNVKEGQMATERYHSLKEDYKEMINICRGLDITISDTPGISVLQNAIYLKITDQKDWKTKDGTRNITKFLALTDMTVEERSIRAKVGEAIGLGIITREGKRYEFDQTVLGQTPDKIYEFLSKKENKDIRKEILVRIEEMSTVSA